MEREQKANIVPVMAFRPDPSQFDKPLSKEEVIALRHHLSGIDPYRVQRANQQAYERCRFHGDVLPKASAIQQLVTAWKYSETADGNAQPGRD